MSMSNRIEIGDKVRVVWSENEVLDGIVLYMPVSTGDCWIIETDSSIHYVQSFTTIWKNNNGINKRSCNNPQNSQTHDVDVACESDKKSIRGGDIRTEA